MDIEEVIKNTKIPLTTKKIIEILEKNALCENIIIHSSMSKMGYVIGGEEAVVDALIQAYNGFTITMPSQSGDNSNPKYFCNPPIPESWKELYKDNYPNHRNTSPVRGMGKIVEEFMKRQVVRSNHPQDSFVSLGKDSDFICSKQLLSHPLGPEGPLGKLYDLKAKILLIGVNYNNCTALHLAEELANIRPLQEQASMFNGKWTKFACLDYDADDFIKIGNLYEIEKEITEFELGNATCKFIDLKSLVDFALDYFNKQKKGCVN